MRWLISIVCLVLLGMALVANAQSPAAGSSAAPLNVQIIKTVGEDSYDTTTVTGYQASIWVAWSPPVQQYNYSPIDYQLAVSSSNATQKPYTATCAQLTGVALCYGSILRYFDQQVTNGNTYTISVATVNAYGAGAPQSAATTARVPYNGNPDPVVATSLSTSYASPSSFVLTFTPPQMIGQTGLSTAAGGGNTLISPYFEVHVKTALNNWWPVNNLTFSSPTPFSTVSIVIQTYVTDVSGVTPTTQYLATNTTYAVRVRAVGQFGRGGWSNQGITIASTTNMLAVNSGIGGLLTATTTTSVQSPNEVTSTGITQSVKTAIGGVINWNSYTAAALLPQTVGSIATGSNNYNAISGWNVYIAPKCTNAGGNNCTGLSTNFGGANTSYSAGAGPAWTLAASTSGSTAQLMTDAGRVIGGSAYITTAKNSNNAATTNDQWFVSLQAVNGGASDNSGAGARQWNSANIGSLAISLAQTTQDASAALISCWGITVAVTGNTNSCLWNFTGQPTVVNGTFNGGGVTDTRQGGFVTATPYTVAVSANANSGTIVGSISSVSVLGPATFGGVFGSFGLKGVLSANVAGSTPVISAAVNTSITNGTNTTGTTIVTTGAAVATPVDNTTAVQVAGATFLTRGRTLSNSAAGFLTSGTDWVIMNVVRPTSNSLYVAGTSDTTLPSFAAGNLNGGIDFFTGSTATIAYNTANAASARAVTFLNGASTTTSLNSASFIVAVQTPSTTYNRFGVGFAPAKTAGVVSPSTNANLSTVAFLANTVPVITVSNNLQTQTTQATATGYLASSGLGVATIANTGFAGGATVVGNACLFTFTSAAGTGGMFLGILVAAAGATNNVGVTSVTMLQGGTGFRAGDTVTIIPIAGPGGCTETAAATWTKTINTDGSVTVGVTAGSGQYITAGANGSGVNIAGVCTFNVSASVAGATAALGYAILTGTATANGASVAAATDVKLYNAGSGYVTTGTYTINQVCGAAGTPPVLGAVTNANLGPALAGVNILNPGIYTSSGGVILQATYNTLLINVGTATASTTANSANYATPGQFFACCSNNGSAAAATAATIGAQTATTTSVSVVDVSDTGANLFFTFGGNTWITNLSYATAALADGVVTVAGISFTDAGAGNGVVSTVPPASTTTFCSTTVGNAMYYDNYICQVNGTFVPGRNYTLQAGAKLNIGTNLATVATAGVGTGFWTASIRPSAAKVGANTNKGAYYIGTNQAYIYWQLPTDIIGQGGASGFASGGIVTTTLTSAPTTYPSGLQIVGSYPFTGTTVVSNTGAGNTGTWYTIVASGLVPTTATNTFTYVNTIYPSTSVNANVAGTSIPSYSTSVANTTITAPTASPGTSSVRWITGNSAVVEFQAPTNIGTNIAPAVGNFSVTSTNCAVTSSVTAVDGSLNNGTGTGATFFPLVQVSGLTYNAGSTSCTLNIVFTNTGNSAGNTTGTFSNAVTVTLATGNPAAPSAFQFDQVQSSSLVVGYNFPNTWGAQTTSATTISINPAATPTFTFTVTGGAAKTATTAQLQTNTVSNAGISGVGYILSTYYGLYSIYTGGYQQIIGTTVNSVNTALAANTAYTVTVTAQFVTGAGAPSSNASSNAQTTNRLGDVPDAPTNVSISRVTNTTVRLTFTQPIAIGGDQLCASSSNPCTTSVNATALTAPYRYYYINGSATGSPPTNLATQVTPSNVGTVATWAFYSTATGQGSTTNGAGQPWYGPGTSGSFTTYYQLYYADIAVATNASSSSVSVYVVADNQFSTTFFASTFVPAGCATGNTNTACGTNIYTAITANPSAAATQTIPAATAKPGDSPSTSQTTVTLTQYGWTFIALSFNAPQLLGGAGTAAVTYTVGRATTANGTTTAVTSGSLGNAYGDTIAVVDNGTALANNTTYFYTITWTSSGGSTPTSFSATTQNAGDVPTQPNAPTITGSTSNAYTTGQTGYSPNVVQDVTTNITWILPLGIGNTSVSSLVGWTATQTVAQQQDGSATPAPSKTLANCTTTYTWQNAAVTTSLVQNFSFSTIPGKTYSYAVQAINFNNATTPAFQTSSFSPVLKQAAYPIVAPYPAPALSATAASSVVGSGYVTFVLTYPNNLNLGQTSSTTYNLPPATGTQYGLVPTTLTYDSYPAPISPLNNYVGVQLLQQSNLGGSNNNATAFVPDTFVPQAYNGLPASGATISCNGLNANTIYRFSVTTFNGYFYTQAANYVSITTKALTTPGTVNTIQSLQNRRLGGNSNPSIWLQWAQPLETGGEGFVSNWSVKYGAGTTAATANSSISVTSGARIVTAQVNSNLVDNTRYFVTVTGSNSKFTSANGTFGTSVVDNGANNVVRTGSIPYEPTTFAVSANGGTSIDFSWVSPSNTAALAASTGVGTLAITNQIIVGTSALASASAPALVTAFTNPTITQPSSTSATTTTANSITTQNGNFYRFAIYNTNALNNAATVDMYNFNFSLGVYVQANPSTSTTAPVPGQVTSVQLDYSSIVEYRLSFTPAAGTTAVPAASWFYLIYWQQIQRFSAAQNTPTANDGGATNVVVTANTTVPLATPQATGNTVTANCAQLFNVIRPSSLYKVVVISGNSNGLGLQSKNSTGDSVNTAAPLVPANATPGPQPSAPNAPTQTANPTDTTVSIGWSTPSNQGLALIQYYIVNATPSNGGSGVSTSKNVSAATTSARANYSSTVGGLSSGTQYDLTVTGYNSFGQGIPSASTQITTTGNAGFAAASSLWTVVLMAVAALFAFAF